MLNETFYLDGVDAASVGIHQQTYMAITGIEPVVETVHVPGRNGDMVFDTGAYSNRTAKCTCYVLDADDVQNVINSAVAFLMGTSGYRRLECSNDPAHFMRARVKSGISIEVQMGKFNEFELEFDCCPQRYLKSGEQPVEFMEPGSLYSRYQMLALPLIAVTGTGGGTVTVGDDTIQINNLSGTIYIDSEEMNAYDIQAGVRQNRNRDINAPKFPVLTNGENTIAFTGGVQSLKIIPRWWEA